MEEIEKCPCCKSKKIFELYNEIGDLSYFVEGEFSLWQCKNCGLEFINPMLSEKEVAKYYPSQEYYSLENKNTLSLIYHKISSYYFSKKNIFLNFILIPFNSLLYTYYVTKDDVGKSILEIGCGDGLKLEIYKKFGLETFGLEPHGSELNDKEKKLGISRENLKNAKYKKNSFDYIILKEVLEHVPDQDFVLEKCQEWLKPQGKLVISVQNTKSLWRKVFGKFWFGYDVPRHLYNYNPKNISFFLKKKGFKINKIKVYDNPYMLTGSWKFKLISQTGKKNHSIIYSNFSNILFTPLSLIVTYLGLGSLIEIECEKK